MIDKRVLFSHVFLNSTNRKHILQCNLHMSHWQQFLLKCCELLFHDSDDGASLSSNHDCSSQHQRSNHSIYGHKVRCFRDMIKPSSKKERNPWIPCDKCKKTPVLFFPKRPGLLSLNLNQWRRSWSWGWSNTRSYMESVDDAWWMMLDTLSRQPSINLMLWFLAYLKFSAYKCYFRVSAAFSIYHAKVVFVFHEEINSSTIVKFMLSGNSKQMRNSLKRQQKLRFPIPSKTHVFYCGKRSQQTFWLWQN